MGGLAVVDPPQGLLSGVVLLAGRPGGQIVNGGTDSGDGLTFRSTRHATKGSITLDQFYDIILTQSAKSGGVATAFTLTGGAHTSLTASTEVIDVDFNLARTVQWATGAKGTQRAVLIQAPTYAFVGPSTVNEATTVAITGNPAAGANATFNQAYALHVQDGDCLFESVVSIAPILTGPNPSGFVGQITFYVQPAALLAIAAGVEIQPIYFSAASQQWATGAIATQRNFFIQAPTYSFVGPSTITFAATVAIEGAPSAGANATFTNSYALWVQAGAARFDGGITVGAEPAGKVSTVSYTNTVDNAANSTGIGTILFKGTTIRNSSGFLKILDGTTARFIPYFDAITG